MLIHTPNVIKAKEVSREYYDSLKKAYAISEKQTDSSYWEYFYAQGNNSIINFAVDYKNKLIRTKTTIDEAYKWFGCND